MKNIIWAIVYFGLSALITWWFIKQAELLYFTPSTMVFSGSIAAAKWGIQIVAALLFLPHKKWEFIKLIGFTCLIGSCILLPYCILSQLRHTAYGFVFSIGIAVFFMMLIYYRVVKQMELYMYWYWGWVLCLSIAVYLQIFVVFKIWQYPQQVYLSNKYLFKNMLCSINFFAACFLLTFSANSILYF